MGKTGKMNSTVGDILKNALKASLGLMAFGLGEYLTIQANLGTAPWDTFHIGLHLTLGVSYGTASIATAVLILIVDALMREPIGVGMILDALLVGKTIDLLNFIDLVPPAGSFAGGAALMLLGIVIMGFSQAAYMGAALCCGPRDTLLVGLKKRLKRIPIGAISVTMLTLVTLIGWLLGGTVGVGTLIGAFMIGPVMQLDFRILRFDPTAVQHQTLRETAAVFAGRR